MAHTALGLLVVLAMGACADPAEVGDEPDRAALAGGVGESPASPTSSPDPSDAVIDPGPGESPAPTPIGGQPWDVDVSAACEQELAEQQMPAFQEVAQTANDGGVTSFWAAGKKWVVCDGLVGQDVPAPALLVSGPNPSLDTKELGLSTTVVTDPDGALSAVRFAAGGKLPWPVYEMTYTFPDGHTEKAAFVRSDDGSADTWWSVSYTATDGVLVDQDTDPADLEPLAISIVAGAAEAFRLPWDEVDCAQTNFTC